MKFTVIKKAEVEWEKVLSAASGRRSEKLIVQRSTEDEVLCAEIKCRKPQDGYLTRKRSFS